MTLGYLSTVGVTCTLAGLPSDNNLISGRQSAVYSNATNLAIDALITSKVTPGGSQTTATGTVIECWIIPALDDVPNWPDSFGSADAGRTVASRSALFNYGTLLTSMDVPASSAVPGNGFNQARGLRSAMGVLAPPKNFVLWYVHNTGASLSPTGALNGTWLNLQTFT